MRNYNNTIQQILNNLNIESVKTNSSNSTKETCKVTLHLPEMIYNKPIEIVSNSVEDCAFRIFEIHSDFYDVVNDQEYQVRKQYNEPLSAEDIAVLKAASKERLETMNAFEAGYFTIEGDSRKFSTNQMPFHYYFAKGRISFEEMLDYAAEIYTPAKNVA